MAAKNTILIVDDEPDIVNLTDKFLKLGNFNTITCNNGRDAIEIVEEKSDEIALILLDIMMPGTSGYSVLKDILFTVKSFNEDVQKGKDLGADGYLTKPFSGKDLLQFVRDKLNE